tara:strand:+ start:23 stop:976 length:954 start_codon:yes stop_codon:yes gene_type:complete
MLVLHNYLLNQLYGLPSNKFFIQIPRKISPVMGLYIYLKKKTLISDKSSDLLIHFYFYIFKNIINKEDIEVYINFYGKIQKMYHGFNKLALIWKYKHCNYLDLQEDLELTNFSTIKEKHKILLLEDNNVYLFNIKNLINIVINGLTNNEEMCCTPIKIKNPYTNNAFKKSSLYKIYFKLIESNIVIPELFYLFFKSNFDISYFLMNYEANIKNYIIKNFHTLLTDEEKEEHIKDMIEYNTKLSIHDEFPIDILVKTFYSCLGIYLFSRYSLNPNKRIASRKLLSVFLKKYNSKTCLYGRKIYEKNMYDKTSYYFVTC